LTPFQIQSTCELVEILPFWMEWKWRRMPSSCFAYTLWFRVGNSCADSWSVQLLVGSCADSWSVQLLDESLVRIAKVSSCLSALVRIAKVSSCLRLQFWSEGECRYPLGYLQCLAPLVGADLDFDVRWIRPPVDWGGG